MLSNTPSNFNMLTFLEFSFQLSCDCHFHPIIPALAILSCLFLAILILTESLQSFILILDHTEVFSL